MCVYYMQVDSMEKVDVERAVHELTVDTSCLSALSLAAHNGHLDVIQTILTRRNGFVNCLPALSMAVEAGYTRSARLLLKHAVQQGQVELSRDSVSVRIDVTDGRTRFLARHCNVMTSMTIRKSCNAVCWVKMLPGDGNVNDAEEGWTVDRVRKEKRIWCGAR